MKKEKFLQKIQEIIDIYRSLWFFQDEKKFSTEYFFEEVFWWFTDEFYSSYEMLSFDEDNIIEVWFKKESIETWESYYKNILKKLWDISRWSFSPENIQETWSWDDVYHINWGTKIKLSFTIKWKEYFVYFTPWIRWSDWDRWEYLIYILQKDGYLMNLYAKSTEESFIFLCINSKKDAEKLIKFEQKNFKWEITNIEKLEATTKFLGTDIQEILSPESQSYPIISEEKSNTVPSISQIIILILTIIFAALWFFWSIDYLFEWYVWNNECNRNILEIDVDNEACLICLEHETQEQCNEKLDKIMNILEENILK